MKINDNLSVYAPRAGMPFNNYFPAVNIFNQRNIIEAIGSKTAGYEPDKVILWLFVPYAAHFAEAFGKYFTVYHSAGNYPAEKGNFLRKRAVSNMELSVIKRADIVIAQTQSLCRKFGSMGKKTFYFPSAIDIANFSEKPPVEGGDISEFANIKHPRIGVVGYFDDNFYDTELLRYLLDARKNWSFIFIGPVTGKARQFRRLQNRPNAFFLGHKRPNEMPHYLRKLDIGIIPYKVNDYMKEVSPTKFYEYLACGKPVVSTELPDIKGCGDILKTANNKTEFVSQIEYFLSYGDKDALRDDALRLAAENSFDTYFKGMSDLLEGAICEESG